MFIPLHDANRLRHIRHQYVTLVIIGLNIVTYLLTSSAGIEFSQAAAYGFGYIPSVNYNLAILPPELAMVPPSLTYITYAFVHNDLLHLGGNMLFLWVFGDNVEDALGHLRFLIFYLACTVAGAVAHGMVMPWSQMPLIGASGAVAGVVSAYFLLHPKVKLWVLMFARIPLRLPAYLVLATWIATQFLMILFDTDGMISWAAHIGGIIAGTVLIIPLRRRGVPLFDRGVVAPEPAKLD